jgi:hypothetical protein
MKLKNPALMLCGVLSLVGCVATTYDYSVLPQIQEESVSYLDSLDSRELFILYGETYETVRKDKLRAELTERGVSDQDLIMIQLGDVIGMPTRFAFAAFGKPVNLKTTTLATEMRETYTFRISTKGHFELLEVLVVNGMIVRIDR